MPLDGEPKNGDYVAYVEALVNRGASSPGQVAPAARGRPRWTDALRPAGAAAEPLDPLSWPTGDGFGAPGTDHVTPTGGQHGRKQERVSRMRDAARDAVADAAGPAEAPPTLAQAASRRKQGLAMIGMAALLGVVAVDMARDAAARGGSFEDFMPTLFLLVFAGIFLRAGFSSRRRGRTRQASLPPLSTVPPSGGRRKLPTTR